jgi:hypothetical protein
VSPLIAFESLGKSSYIWYGGDAIQGDRDAVSFSPISSTFLKWLRFKFLVEGMIFSLTQQWFGIV